MRNRSMPKTDEKKEVIINNDGQSFSCLLTDISPSGISVSSDHFVPTYKEIEVVMEIKGKPVTMKGSVRWSIDPGTAGAKTGKLGILIMDPPPAFLAYVATRGKTGHW
ncbi:MAG: PilZ domain-containing protein [Candidatus Aminicenantes bacterium]|nr:PilZ domain-containing protein [Candidatus Aminicenantes bacterium]